MTDLSQEALSLFEQARAAGAPSEAEKDLLFEHLSAKIAGLPAGSPTPNPAPPSTAPAPSASALGGGLAKVWLVSSALSLVMGAGMAGWWLMPATGDLGPAPAKLQAAGSKPEQAPVRVEELASPPARLGVPEPAASRAVLLPAANEARPQVSQPSPRPTPVRAPSAPVNIPAPSAEAAVDGPSASTSTLAEELAILRAAQHARAAGDFATALSLLDRHRADYPSGVLRAERRVARAVFLCENGDRAGGLLIGQQLLNTAFGNRIRNACGIENETEQEK